MVTTRLAQTLRVGGSDVVLPQDFKHRRAHHPRFGGGAYVADHHGGPDELLEVDYRVFPQGDVADGRAPAQQVRAEHQQQSRAQERRYGQPRERQNPDYVVGFGILPQRHENAGGYAERDGDDFGRYHDFECDGYLLLEFVEHWPPGEQGVAPVAPYEAPYPVPILDMERVVQSERLADAFEVFLADGAFLSARLLGGDGLRDVSRRDSHEREHEDGYENGG